MKQTRTERLVFGLLSVLPLAVGFGLYAFHPGIRASLDEAWALLIGGDVAELRVWGEAQGAWAPLATFVLMVVQALAAPVPAVLITAANALMFGWFAGGLLSIAQATLAAGICFGLARTLGEPVVARMVPEAKRPKLERLVADHGVSAVLIARLLPFVPFDPISYLAGLGPMRVLPFLGATFLGQIPAGLGYSWVAVHAAGGGRWWVAAPGVVLALVVVGVGVRRVLGGGGALKAPSSDSARSPDPCDDAR